jgi:hypothetical protein
MTLTVLSDLAGNLNQLRPDGYVIIKSIKPYPAIPNDTDVLILGNKKDFKDALSHLMGLGYEFHEWAPMQTTLYDPRGKGKIGKGKKGGTYYIDVYENISTDYVCYLDKMKIHPFIVEKTIKGKAVRLLEPEPELAIILFHNVFPERTYQLEHFYMPLYYLAKTDFDLPKFVAFVENNHLTYAVRTNLTLIEALHQKCFGGVPAPVRQLLDHWGRNLSEAQRFQAAGMETPYMFSPRTFWLTFLYKLADPAFLRSLFSQAFHMLNPVFSLDVLNSLIKRFSERGTYHME